MNLAYFSSGIRLSLDVARCTGCGRCVEVCPQAVFELRLVPKTDGPCGCLAGRPASVRRAHVVARERCMECGACGRNCATAAIRASAGVGCATAIIHGFFTGSAPSCDCGGSDAATASGCGADGAGA
jgi:NAD-dependent dihydropyrimidine dehydrogenase PreA subunit